MTKYDYDLVPREDLVSLARAAIEGSAYHVSFTAALNKVSASARVKARAEYDREIGDMMRCLLSTIKNDGEIYMRELDRDRLRALVNASRNAPEET